MGQRSAILTFLLGGGLLLPVALLVLFAESLGSTAVPVGLGAASWGAALLIRAKRRLLVAGEVFSVGTARLSPFERRLYWWAYGLVSCGLLLSLFAWVLS